MFPEAPDLKGRTSALIVPFDTSTDRKRVENCHFST